MDTRPIHLEHLNRLNAEGTLKMAGPSSMPKRKPNGSLVIVSAETIEAAKAIAGSDPYTKAGLVRERRGQAIQLGLQQSGGISMALAVQIRAVLVVLGGAEESRREGHRMDWRAQLSRPQQHAGDADRRLGFFYHFNDGLEIVGIVEVCALSHPDSTAKDDPPGDCVDIRRRARYAAKPVSLKDIKAQSETFADGARHFDAAFRFNR